MQQSRLWFLVLSAPFFLSVGCDGGASTTSASTPASAPSGDTAAPTISGVSTTNVTATSATVTWTTNENSTSQVNYGSTSSYGSSANGASNVTSHGVPLSGLSANTTYHFSVSSTDASGNTALSTDATFTTATAGSSDTTAPTVSNVSTTNVTASSATVTWTTNENSTSVVNYGLTSSYGLSADGASSVTSHGVSLSGLSANTTYHFRVSSADASGNTASSTNATFTTATAPAPGNNFPLPFDTGLRYSRDLYVNATAAPGGNGSSTSPYNTIGAALGQATAGTRVRIAAGTYGSIGSFRNLQGTAQAPIALVAEGAVVIDTGQTALALHLIDPRYVVLQGITIQNTWPHGINIDDGGDYSTPAEYVVLRNMTFRNIGDGGNNDCLKMSGVDNFYIEGSSFSGCNRGEAIDMVGCHNGVITGNQFFDLPVNGVQTKGGSADVLIHGNRFTNIAQRSVNAGGSTDPNLYRPINTTHEGVRIQMIANLFERTGSTPVAFVGCDTCVFANNTIIEPGTYLARLLEENTLLTPGANGYYLNNIIVLNTNGRGSVVNIGANSQPTTYTFGSNLWYSLDNAAYTGPVLGGGIPAETGSLVQRNPQLDTNLRPQSGSPALGAGRAVPRGLAGDFDRQAYSNPPTLGAYAGP